LRTEKGALPLPDDVAVDRAVFVDAYHRIWDPAEILGRLRKAMPPQGRLVIADRSGPDGEERRVAGHRRRISPALVREELERAGFRLVAEEAQPAPDRFVSIFAPGASPAAVERLF
jgi:predicted methyltransferase